MCDKQTKIVNDQSRCSLLLLLYAVAFDLFFRVLSHRFDGLSSISLLSPCPHWDVFTLFYLGPNCGAFTSSKQLLFIPVAW